MLLSVELVEQAVSDDCHVALREGTVGRAGPARGSNSGQELV